MKYWKARQLSSKKFKRKTGISPRTYRIMIRLVKDKEVGKKKPGRPPELRIEEQTLKTQLIIEQKTLKIICLKHGKGKTHDFQLFKNSGIKFSELLKLIADKGYQGIAKIHKLSETPIKKPRGGKLTKEQKKYNRELNRLRIVVEHVNRRLKIFKILAYPYRNRHRRFALRSN